MERYLGCLVLGLLRPVGGGILGNHLTRHACSGPLAGPFGVVSSCIIVVKLPKVNDVWNSIKTGNRWNLALFFLVHFNGFLVGAFRKETGQWCLMRSMHIILPISVSHAVKSCEVSEQLLEGIHSQYPKVWLLSSPWRQTWDLPDHQTLNECQILIAFLDKSRLEVKLHNLSFLLSSLRYINAGVIENDNAQNPFSLSLWE